MKILTEPKHAIVKQYQKFLALDKVDLVFTEDALEATAEEALKLKTGARGLRTVIEDILLEVMFDIPSRGDVKKVVINAETIKLKKPPILLNRADRVIDSDEIRDASA
jgi:ATP-dependent Clp protease ATP-binding subunit ClpX